MDSLTARVLRCNPSRCDQCGGRLETFEQERYCPDCTAYRPTYATDHDDADVIDLGRDDDDDLIDLSRED
jgi:hypothetical protein